MNLIVSAKCNDLPFKFLSDNYKRGRTKGEREGGKRGRERKGEIRILLEKKLY